MKKDGKGNRFWLLRPTNTLLIVVSIVMLGLLMVADKLLFLVVAPIVGVLVTLSIYRLLKIQRDLRELVTSMGRSITSFHESSLVRFPMPCVILSTSGEIIWYNEHFKETVINENEGLFGFPITHLLKADLNLILASDGLIVEGDEKFFECRCLKDEEHTPNVYLLFLNDITDLQQTKLLSLENQPVVILALIDNYDESIGTTNEGEVGRLLANVQNLLQSFADEAEGFIKKLSHDRYLIVMKSKSLEAVTEKRFDILDKAREIVTENHSPVTLSLGVAPLTESFSKAERDARLALDMALGRGGDQAVIKKDSGYEFFGGFSKGVEKRTKVKTRMVASAMVELITGADNILIMGHKFADLDCLGSGIGMAKACQTFCQNVNIVLDIKRNLAGCLVEKLESEGRGNLLVHPDIAIDMIGDKTLLIIVDTHTDSLLESLAVYKRCKQKVVIDHHRKMVNHIEDAVMFYHEPYASSASEMVTELIQYFGDKCTIGASDAEALLSGITLDTRNFVMKTGVRTFEAAAYLRRLGADTVEVRKLFASTIDSYQRKAKLVSSAEIYNDCAIAVCDFTSEDLRIVAPQAADELLNISGVKASFVLYEIHEIVNVSARSMGALNVQIIMEAMGGGGHHTMAAAQIGGSSIDKVRQNLLEVIDRQLGNN